MESRDQDQLAELLLSYQQGDSAAAAALIKSVSPRLARFCLRQGDAPQDLDDVLQEIWLRIHRARRTYRPGAPAEPWLFAVARYARLDVRRRRRRIHAREVPAEESQAEAAFVPAYTASRFLVESLATLPAAQREVLVLLKGCGMSLEEVARATSSTVGAVKQKAHRAYGALRRVLAAHSPEALR